MILTLCRLKTAKAVIPAMIAAGWVVTAPLSMYFHAYETISLFTTVVAVTFIAMTGRSTWMHGVMLIVAYMIVAAGFYVHRDPVSEELCNMTISVSHANGTASWTENITESGTGIIPDSP